MLRRLDAGDIIAHHSDGIREFLLRHSLCLAQPSNPSGACSRAHALEKA